MTNPLSQTNSEGDAYTNYYIENSDLNFEIEINDIVSKIGFLTKHSGRYLDATAQKLREYDILATMLGYMYIDGGGQIERFDHLELVIECKNVSRDCPVIIGLREKSEREYCLKFYNGSNARVEMRRDYVNFNGMARMPSLFPVEFFEFTGVEIMQVARKDGKQGERPLKAPANDTAIYEKWSQAVHHTIARYNELIPKCYHAKHRQIYKNRIWCIPMVVVPDGSLYAAQNNNGKVTVMETSAVMYRIGYEYQHSDPELNDLSDPVHISSCYFLTKSGLSSFLRLFAVNPQPIVSKI